MLVTMLVNAVADLVVTALVVAALVITCAALTPPRPPRGPHS